MDPFFWWAYPRVVVVNEPATHGREAQRTTESLEDRFETLNLVCRAMWTLLQENCGLSEEDLLKKVQEIDLLDGRLDKKFKPQQVKKCAQCQRTMNLRHRQCIYCGEANPLESAFDGV